MLAEIYIYNYINIYNINAKWLRRDTRKSKAIKELTAAKQEHANSEHVRIRATKQMHKIEQ
jgi:hypothetical protein